MTNGNARSTTSVLFSWVFLLPGFPAYDPENPFCDLRPWLNEEKHALLFCDHFVFYVKQVVIESMVETSSVVKKAEGLDADPTAAEKVRVLWQTAWNRGRVQARLCMVAGDHRNCTSRNEALGCFLEFW